VKRWNSWLECGTDTGIFLRLTSVKTQLPYDYYTPARQKALQKPGTPGGHLRRLPFCKPVSVVQSVENLGEILAPQRNSELRFYQDLPKLLYLKMAIPLDFCCFSYQAHVWLFDLEILELLGVFSLSNLQNDWNPWNSSLPIVLTGFSTMFQNVFRSSPRLVIS